MEYRNLGSSELKASEIGLGGDTFGHPVDQAGTIAIVDQALESGMRSLRDDGWLKVRQGITAVSEVLRVTQDA